MSTHARVKGHGSLSLAATPTRPLVTKPYPLRQTVSMSPVHSAAPSMSPLSPGAYPRVVHTGTYAAMSMSPSCHVSSGSEPSTPCAYAAMSMSPSCVSAASGYQSHVNGSSTPCASTGYQFNVGRSPEPITTGAQTGDILKRQAQTVTLQPRNAGEDKRETWYQELKAYIDTQIESIRSSNLASPSSPQHVAEDFDSRLGSAVSLIAGKQARKFEELHGTLEQRMNSVIEQRIEQAMQNMNASHEQRFHQFISTVNHEIDQKMAQAGMQASQEARAIAAQAIEESKSSMHAHVSRDVGMSEQASALLRQHHDEYSAKFQHHDEHIAMFRQRQDEHAALLHELSHKYDELREIHAQNPVQTQNVATMDAAEQSTGTFLEQMSYDVQRTVEDLMKKLDHMNDDMTIERREREGNDSSLSEHMSVLTANERNMSARMDDLTMEVKNMGEIAMALTAQVNSTSERSLESLLERRVCDSRYDGIINQIQNLHSRLSEIELVRQSCSPLLGRVGTYEAQGFAAKPAVVQGSTNAIKSVMVGEGCFKEGGGVREIRSFDEVDPSPVRSAQGTNIAVVSEEELRGLSEKSASLLDRMHNVSQRPFRTRDLATASADSHCDGFEIASIPVRSAEGTNIPLVSEEKLRGLSEKSSSLLDRMHKVSQHALGTRDLAIASADSHGDDCVMPKIHV